MFTLKRKKNKSTINNSDVECVRFRKKNDTDPENHVSGGTVDLEAAMAPPCLENREGNNEENLNVNNVEAIEPNSRTSLAMKLSRESYNTTLLNSIPGGEIAFMRRTLEMGANANATCRLNHVSACHIAAMHDNEALLLLLKSGADGARSDKHGRTPLHLAAWSGIANQIELLLNFQAEGQFAADLQFFEEGPSFAFPDQKPSVPKQYINAQCHHNVGSTLQDDWSDGMEHNCKNLKEMLPQFEQGWTALHAACAHAHYHCVQLLLDAGADVYAQDLLRRTPFDIVGCAHYMGHKIKASDFEKTLQLVLNAGGKIQSRDYKELLDTPLHTAVELDSVVAVKLAILGGASPAMWNSQGLTAMHVCVYKQNKQLFEILVKQVAENEDTSLATVDVQDQQKGYTVLFAAVVTGWIEGVCIALAAGADVMIQSKEESLFHKAAELGHIEILQELIPIVNLYGSIDIRNGKGETALLKAITYAQTDVVRLLIEAGSSIEVELRNGANVFHIAATYDSIEILRYLLEYDPNITAKLINRFDSRGPPLFYSVFYNNEACAKLLISKDAKVNVLLNFCFKTLPPHCGIPLPNEAIHDEPVKQHTERTSLLHIAASKNHKEIAQMIVNADRETIRVTDSEGKTPLHNACYCGNREMIVLLLRLGANLSAVEKGHKETRTPIDILMNNISKPTEFMQEIFDSCITSRGGSEQDSNNEIVVDYKILVPNESDIRQMRVIKALVDTGNKYRQHGLLLHPLVESFLYLKWKKLWLSFIVVLYLHVSLITSIYMFSVQVFYAYDIHKSQPSISPYSKWMYLIYLTAFLIISQEVTFIIFKDRSYLLSSEFLLRLLALLLAVFLPQASWMYSVSIIEPRLVATLALLLSCLNVMYLLPFLHMGYYFLMFAYVTVKVIKILSFFLFLIMGFSISFMIQFEAKPPFEGPWASLFTTMVMMTSEFNYNEITNEKSPVHSVPSIIIFRIVFMSFFILVSIVIMNLLTAVAINDINTLRDECYVRRLKKQADFIAVVEEIYFRTKDQDLMLGKNVVLGLSQATCRNWNIFNATTIREAIFEKAQSQKKQLDEEQGVRKSRMKLDKIYKKLTEQQSRKKLDAIYNKVTEQYEEIIKLRNEMELLKKRT